MNRILQKMGFHKTDEMERYIIFKAQRNSYIFLMIALLIWSLYESSKVYIYHSRLNLLPGFLLMSAAVIQALSQLIMTRNAVKDDDDSYETSPLIGIIILICAVIGLIATAVAAIVLMDTKI